MSPTIARSLPIFISCYFDAMHQTAAAGSLQKCREQVALADRIAIFVAGPIAVRIVFTKPVAILGLRS